MNLFLSRFMAFWIGFRFVPSLVRVLFTLCDLVYFVCGSISAWALGVALRDVLDLHAELVDD